MASSVTGLFCAFLYLFICLASKCEDQVKVEPGHSVTLQCQDPSKAAIELVHWTRTDLKSEDYVFFYRDERTHEKNQHQLFHGRVELRDPQMKDGDASVIVKNVTTNDTGTYECRIIIRNTGSSGPPVPQLITNITLTVTVQTNIPAEPGQTVTLTCRVPSKNPVTLVEWRRPDLKSGYVFFHRSGESDPDKLHPSFKNRVELKDKHLKNGNVSVIVKNVTVNDTGTYECYVAEKGNRPQLIITINLNVTDSGGAAGHTKDKEEPDGTNRGHVGLTVGLSVTVILVGVVGFLIFRKRLKEQNSY